MKKTACVILFSLLATTLPAHAGDMGFRFNGTACVDSKGAAGLNPYYLGQCGDLRHLTISGFNFDGVDFSGSQFDGTNLGTSTLKNAILNSVSLNNTTLSGLEMVDVPRF